MAIFSVSRFKYGYRVQICKELSHDKFHCLTEPQSWISFRSQWKQWYEAIKRITGLDIPTTAAANSNEEDVIIEDANRQVRYKLRGKAIAKMVDLIDHKRVKTIADLCHMAPSAGKRCTSWCTS